MSVFTVGEQLAAESDTREFKMHSLIAMDEVALYFQWIDIEFGKLRRTKQPVSKYVSPNLRAE